MFTKISLLGLLLITSKWVQADVIEITLLNLEGNENAAITVDLDHELDQITGTQLFRRLYAKKCMYWLGHKPPKRIMKKWEDVARNIFVMLTKENVKSIIIMLSCDDRDIIIPRGGAPWIVPPLPALGFKTGHKDEASLNLNNFRPLCSLKKKI